VQISFWKADSLSAGHKLSNFLWKACCIHKKQKCVPCLELSEPNPHTHICRISL